MTISSRLLIFYLALLCSIALPAMALATSASISVSGNEGAITVSASASFTNHTHCSGTGDDKKCWKDNSGSMGVYRNNIYLASKSGNGSANWSDVLNAGLLSQGQHIFKATARDSKNHTDVATKTITIDNTPELTAQITDFEGDMAIHGTVDFKENPAGNEGRIRISVRKGSGSFIYHGEKYFEGSAQIAWTYEDIVGSIPNAGRWSQGEYTLRVYAYAANGALKTIDIPITIDNTPDLTAQATDFEGDMAIHGTVDFKENPAGNEGRIRISVRKGSGSFAYHGEKYFEGSLPIDWSYEDITGSIPNAGRWSQGEYTLRVYAYAANGALKTIDIPITIDNTPEATILGSKCHPDETFDILGTTVFKENSTGNEGTIAIYIKDINASSYTKHGATKSYEGKKVSWKYSDFTGARMQKSVWGQKEILVKVVATAANGASISIVKGAVIPALGCPTTFGN